MMKLNFKKLLYASGRGGLTMYWAAVIGVIFFSGYLVNGLIPKRFPDTNVNPATGLTQKTYTFTRPVLQLGSLFRLEGESDPPPNPQEPPPTTVSHTLTTFCTSTGQLCVPRQSVSVQTASVLKVTYTVLSHCSSIRVHVYLDSAEKAVTPWMGWLNAPAPYSNLPLTSGEIDLGPVSSGEHTLSFQAEGQPGGCNAGSVANWGGRVDITKS